MPKLKHFTPKEFGLWWPFMDRDALLAVDAFREAWGYPVIISPAKGGLGRALDADHDNFGSAHNLLKFGTVKAIDFFPKVPIAMGGFKYIDSQADLARARQVARSIGKFTGLGVYTDTAPGFMLHGDVRPDKTPDAPAEWARVGGKYTSIGAVV